MKPNWKRIIKYVVTLAIIYLLAFLCSCRTIKQVNQESTAISDSVTVCDSQGTTTVTESLSQQVGVTLDSLDIWIYNYPVVGGNQAANDSSRADGRQSTTIHISAKRAALGKKETAETSSVNETQSSTSTSTHIKTANTLQSTTDKTSIVPSYRFWVFIFISVVIAATAIVYIKVKRLRQIC